MYSSQMQSKTHFRDTNPGVWADPTRMHRIDTASQATTGNKWGWIALGLICLIIVGIIGIGLYLFLSDDNDEISELLDLPRAKKEPSKKNRDKIRCVKRDAFGLSERDGASGDPAIDTNVVDGASSEAKFKDPFSKLKAAFSKDSFSKNKDSNEKKEEEQIGITEIRTSSDGNKLPDYQVKTETKERGWYNPKRWFGKKTYKNIVVDSEDLNCPYKKRKWYNPKGLWNRVVKKTPEEQDQEKKFGKKKSWLNRKIEKHLPTILGACGVGTSIGLGTLDGLARSSLGVGNRNSLVGDIGRLCKEMGAKENKADSKKEKRCKEKDGEQTGRTEIQADSNGQESNTYDALLRGWHVTRNYESRDPNVKKSRRLMARLVRAEESF